MAKRLTSWWLSVQLEIQRLECPIQLKVLFTDGTLGVRLLRVSDLTVRIGVARGEGEWTGGLNPLHVGS